MERDDRLSELHEGKACEILERHNDKSWSKETSVLAFGGICVRSGISWMLLSVAGAQTRDLIFPF